MTPSSAATEYPPISSLTNSPSTISTLIFIPVIVQALTLIAIILVCLVWKSGIALSALAGSLATLIPAMAAAFLIRRSRPDGSDPGRFLKLLYGGEFLKIGGTAALLAIVLASGVFQALPVLAAFFLVLLAGWIGLAWAALKGRRHGG